MEAFSRLIRNQYANGCGALLVIAVSGVFGWTACANHRVRPAPPAPPTLSCSAQPSEVMAGEPVAVYMAAANFTPKRQLNYAWTVNGVRLSNGGSATATVDTAGLPPGPYTANATVTDSAAPHAAASCSASFTVKAPPMNPPQLSCSANPSTVLPGDPVTITAAAASPDGSPISYSYSSSGGSISGNGSTARLDTSGAYAPISVTVSATNTRGLTSTCTVGISVAAAAVEPPPPPPPVLETGRDFLLPDAIEKAGYGLYSYLLWYNAPTQQDRTRFINIISAFLQIPTVASEQGTENVTGESGHSHPSAMAVAKQNLNIAYIPVKASPPADICGSTPKPACAEWVLINYNLAAARYLLLKLGHPYHRGPYIVSTLAPLSAGLPANGHYLFQNVGASVVSPELAHGWISSFQNQAMKQDFWNPNMMNKFVLNVREQVDALAEDIPAVKAGLATWIGWFTPAH